MLLSFLVDIPIFLPILGVFLFWLSSKEKGVKIAWMLVGIVFVIVLALCLFLKQFLLAILLVTSFILSLTLQKLKKNFLFVFGTFTLAIFWIVSGGLYFDLWGEGGNHFMWYSWLDKMGIVKTFPIATPTYQNFFGFFNLLGLALFLIYPVVMLVIGKYYYRFFRWLKGVFFGNIRGQSGLWGLFTNQ